MYIRVKINNNEIEFNNKYEDECTLLYRSHQSKTNDVLADQQFNDICNLISHMAKELKQNYD